MNADTRPTRHGVFVSYARADGEAAAREVCACLERDAPDVPAWLDRFEIEGGVGWWNQIEQALDRAEFLLLVMTPAAMRSDNTRREWRAARQRGVCVYPLKGVPDAELDYPSLPNWMRKAHFYDPQLEWQKLIGHLRRGCVATRVPFMAPALPAGFVPRPALEEALAASLLAPVADGARRMIALRGPGGFGKTTLATAVCYDDRVAASFDDGILWVTLGQSPNLLNEIVKVYAALTGDRPGFVDVEDASRELALRLDSKAFLIVVDDVWNVAHVRPFLNGGPNCARLITTRLLDVAADAHRIEIDRMTSNEGVELLLARAGLQTDDVEPFRELVERLGEWPLPITLAGSAMRQRIERGDTPANALGYLDRALEKRGATAFDRPGGTDRGDAVGRTVAASLDMLNAEDERRCAELSVFPEDVAIPLSHVATLWGLDDLDTEDLARRLDDLALVTFDLRKGTIRLHDVLRTLLHEQVPDPSAAHARLLDAWADPYSLPDARAWKDYAYHAVNAGRGAALRQLLLDARWIEARLRAAGAASLAGDFTYLADDPVLDVVHDALQLSAPALARDPAQLRAQLLGRLMARPEPELRALCDAARRGAGARLEPMHPSLDAPGGMLQMTLVGHAGEITSLAVDAAYTRLISASEDGTVCVWSLESGERLATLNHKRLGVRGVAATSDAAFALSAGADGMLYFWDVARSELASPLLRTGNRAQTSVALSADGTVAVCGSKDPEVIVWDAACAAVRHVLAGHQEQVTSVGVSADGTLAISGSDDGTVRVWSLTSGAPVRVLEGHTASVNAVALSAEGKYALSGSGDRTIRLWDVETGACLRTLVGHQAAVTAVALAARGWRALSGASDAQVRLWDLERGAPLALLEGHSDAVRAIVVDDEGTHAATGSLDRTIKLWRLDERRSSASAESHAGGVVALVFSGDGRLCASGGADGRVTVRDVQSGAVVRSFEAHNAPVRSLAFTHDDSCILSTGVEGSFKLWTIDDGASVSIPIFGHAAMYDCTYSARARFMLSTCRDQFVYIWEVPSGILYDRYGTRRLFDHLITPSPKRRELPDSDEYWEQYLPGEEVHDATVVHMSHDGEYALVSATVPETGVRSARRDAPEQPAGHRSCVVVLRVTTGEVRSVRSRQSAPIARFVLDPQADRLLWARADNALEYWDLEAEERIALMRGHEGTVNALAIGPDGRFAFSCGRDRDLIAWDLSSHERIAAFTADAALRVLSVSPAGDVVAAGDIAGRVHLLRFRAS